MKDYLTQVIENKPIAKDIYEMSLVSLDGDFEKIRCGQFLQLEVPGKLLRRPFGVYKFDNRVISISYAVVGDGTRAMTRIAPGDKVKATLPLGNGWWLSDKYKKVVLLGGGLGCVPLAYVPETYPDREYHAFLGFSDKSRVAFTEEFERRCDTTVCTDDGSVGYHGFAMSALESGLAEIKPDVVLVCGPRPMIKAAQGFAALHKLEAYASMEERMGCGVGACLVCACRIKQKDGSTAARRVCTDGPVFKLEDIEL